MNKWIHQLLGISIIGGIIVTGWLIPWRLLAMKADQFIETETDERPPWLPVDGQIWPVKLFPELFAVLGKQYGGDGETTFAVPSPPEDGIDDFADAQFGIIVVYRCMATHKLEDGTPAGTIAWCRQPPKSYVP
jgi:hypothetical protein